jgi:hypothetical protein
MSPFVEEVFGYKPADSPLQLKCAAAVVVRSSLLEDAHSSGPVESGGIEAIIDRAAGPLSHFLAARRRIPVMLKDNMFAGLADAYPRAWSCLSAVGFAYGAGGGRRPYRVPTAPVPELPLAEVNAPSATVAEIVKEMEAKEQIKGDLRLLHSRRPETVYLSNRPERSAPFPRQPSSKPGSLDSRSAPSETVLSHPNFAGMTKQLNEIK